jgi:pimeloyl-ACP methyl ester carboxylesterase
MSALSRGVAAALALALGACGSAQGGAQPARDVGTVVLVPGSGFRGADRYDDARLSIGTGAWLVWGFRTRVAPYGPGKAGPDDVAAAVRAAKRAAPHLPLCVYGESSGGTWALLAAARTGDVDCVIVSGAPTDEDTWRRSKAGPARTFSHRIWPAYFGTGSQDDAFEPYDVWARARPSVPVLYLAAANDPTVPPSQGRVLATLGGDITVRVLRKGRRPFVHSKVSAGDFERTLKAIELFMLRATR